MKRVLKNEKEVIFFYLACLDSTFIFIEPEMSAFMKSREKRPR